MLVFLFIFIENAVNEFSLIIIIIIAVLQTLLYSKT